MHLCDPKLSRAFSDIGPKMQVTKIKQDKQDFVKIKNYHTSNDTIKTVKDHTENGRKYLQIIYQFQVSVLHLSKGGILSLELWGWPKIQHPAQNR